MTMAYLSGYATYHYSVNKIHIRLLSVSDQNKGKNKLYLRRKLSDGKKLMEARLKRLNNLSRSQVIKAKLLQLKFRMEDYLKQPIYEEYDFFTSFLSNYIDTIYDKRSMFAKDINITPVSLSQILNNHREPKEEFMFRLMLQSELTFKNICEFQKETWYQVYYHEKICDTMSNQDEWRPLEKEICENKKCSFKINVTEHNNNKYDLKSLFRRETLHFIIR